MPSRRWTLAVICMATAMLMLDIAVVNTALSHIATDLHTGLSGLQWVVDAYTLALASTVLSAGFLADRLGRRRMFVGGLALFTVASAACAAAPTIGVLVAARAVQGLGAALLFATALAILAETFRAAAERTQAIAVWGATVGGSFAIGPLAGGALVSYLDWRWIFAVNIPIGLAGIAISLRRVAESRDPFPRSLDYPGQASLIAAMFLLVLGLLRGNEQGWGSAPIVIELSTAVALFALFVSIERRAKQPMVPLALFRMPVFAGTQLSVFAISASLFAVFLYTTLYLQTVLGLSPVTAGLVYIPGTMANFLVAGASAQFVPKLPRHVPVAVGLALVAIGLVMFTSCGVHSHWQAFLPGLIVAMIGTGLVNTSLSGIALSILPERHSGLASGVHDMFRQGGIAVGVAALGALVPASAALGGDPQAYVDGLRDALLVSGAVAGIGALVAFATLRPSVGHGAQLPAGVAAEVA